MALWQFKKREESVVWERPLYVVFYAKEECWSDGTPNFAFPLAESS